MFALRKTRRSMFPARSLVLSSPHTSPAVLKSHLEHWRRKVTCCSCAKKWKSCCIFVPPDQWRWSFRQAYFTQIFVQFTLQSAFRWVRTRRLLFLVLCMKTSPKMPRNSALHQASPFYVVALVQHPKPQWQRHCEQASMTPAVLWVESVYRIQHDLLARQSVCNIFLAMSSPHEVQATIRIRIPAGSLFGRIRIHYSAYYSGRIEYE